MIKHYTFNYSLYEAQACFEVDTEKFSKDMAQATLDFFTWDYDDEADAIDEVMKKYAMESIRVGAFNSWNETGVISDFNEKEGFFPIDGSYGITLNLISNFEFDEDELEMIVVTD